MSQRIRTQIMLDWDKYNFLIEESKGRKHKNLSQTMNELIHNYQIMVRKLEEKYKEIDEKIKAQARLNEVVDNYKKQILKPVKEDLKIEKKAIK